MFFFWFAHIDLLQFFNCVETGASQRCRIADWIGREEDFWNLFQRNLGPLSGTGGNEGQRTMACSLRNFPRNSKSKPRWETYFTIISLQNSGS